MKLSKNIVIVIVIAALAAASLYFYFQYQSLSATDREAKGIVSKISSFYDLPNETPTLLTVTDKSKLEQQRFFLEAQNGDKVLVFVAAKQAVLYRPSSGKIVDVAPIQTTK